MTALAEALLAAQRQAIGAASKAFVAGALNETEFLAALDDVGATDTVEQGYLLASLHLARKLGTSAPAVANGKPESDLASEAQMRLLHKVANERGFIPPDYQLTKDVASRVIDEMKAGTYNADSYSVPF